VSMNLTYDHLDENGEYTTMSAFAFQTQTSLTYKVLATKDKKEQLEIIKKAMVEYGLPEDEIKRLATEIECTLANPRIELGII